MKYRDDAVGWSGAWPLGRFAIAISVDPVDTSR
jgi:hypothetical protein